MKALELSNQAQAGRMTTLEETVQKLIQELLIQLRESREENKFLRVSDSEEIKLEMVSYF